MKIGLISDTHIPSMGVEPPPQVARAFEGVDLILHAGDIYTPACLEWLERIALSMVKMVRWKGVGHGVLAGDPECYLRELRAFFAE